MKRYLTESHNYGGILQEQEFSSEKTSAILSFVPVGFVLRRRAAHGARYDRVLKQQTIVTMNGGSLIRKTKAMECIVEPFATRVPREDSASSVSLHGQLAPTPL